MKMAPVDLTAFIALAERCAAGTDPKSLSAIVRQASGYEPLALQFDGAPGGTVKLQASDRSEAIQLASELVVAGHRVRVGLAGLDTRDIERLGLSLADAFEPCSHVKAAARLLAEDPGKLKPPATTSGAKVRPVAKPPVAPGPMPPPSAAELRPAQAWDVYGGGRPRSVLVYGGRD